MAGFTFKLEHEDGTPADPPVLHTAVPTWRPWRHDSAWERTRRLCVVETRFEENEESVLSRQAGVGSR